MIRNRRRKREAFLPWLQLALDLAVIYGLLYGVFWVRFESGWYPSLLATQDHRVYFRSFHLIALITVFFLRYYGLYQNNARLTFVAEAWRVLKAMFVSTLVLTSMTFFFRPFSFSRTFLPIAEIALAVGIPVSRFLLGLAVMTIDNRRGSQRNVLIIGSGRNAEKLIEHYRRNPRFATKVYGILDAGRPKGSTVYGVPVYGSLNDLQELLKKENQVHEVMLCDPPSPTTRCSRSSTNAKRRWWISAARRTSWVLSRPR